MTVRDFGLMKSRLFIALLGFIPVALMLAGCRLAAPGSASFASVVIPNRSPSEIQSAAAQVFQADGYVGGRTGPMQMAFQKDGTHGQNLAYEGIANTHYGAQSVVRVRAEIVDLGNGSYRLQCHAFIATKKGHCACR